MSSSILSVSVRSIPLALTIFRICSAPVLVVLAAMGKERYFLGLVVAALLSDAVDGAIARRLGAASETGRLLDSWADLLIALVSFVGATLLWPDTMRREAFYFALVLTALVVPNAYALLRFRRLLGYHTISAKASGVVLAFAAVIMFMGLTPVPFRVASFIELVVAAEYILISCLVPDWTGEMKSFWHAMRERRSARLTSPADALKSSQAST